jgi:hypothetical protein
MGVIFSGLSETGGVPWEAICRKKAIPKKAPPGSKYVGYFRLE